jgi:NADP-dependent 3-hydroxy acid dehydrogenase YdfG
MARSNGSLAGTGALVTGASSPIGAPTAGELVRHGAAVALVARRVGRLEVPADGLLARPTELQP